MSSWEESLKSAEEVLAKGKFFDGVQHINAAMVAYTKVVGEEDERIVKDPSAFVEACLPNLSEEQKDVLGRMYEVRAGIISGLGAHKRAVVDYECVEKLVPGKAEAIAPKKAAAAELSKAPAPAKSDKVPVTIITGFLGAGKTTLLNRILHENHGKRIAVIENEFGEVGIDDSLIEMGKKMDMEENIIEMNNGCICCTVRGDLIAGLKKIVKNAAKKDQPVDFIIIETTGLADPAPVAQTFFADDFVQRKLCLDGILTVADSKHLIEHLDEVKPEGVENEAVEQVAFADRILLNKTDLVTPEELVEVERRIRMINGKVQIQRCQNSVVDMDFLLGIKAFDLDKIMEMDDGFLDEHAAHVHDDRVSSVGFNVQGEVDQEKLNAWLGWLLKERGVDMFRTKGVLAVQGMAEKFVFQAVHMAFSGAPQRPWDEGEERVCKLTFIGKNLNRAELHEGFTACIV